MLPTFGFRPLNTGGVVAARQPLPTTSGSDLCPYRDGCRARFSGVYVLASARNHCCYYARGATKKIVQDFIRIRGGTGPFDRLRAGPVGRSDGQVAGFIRNQGADYLKDPNITSIGIGRKQVDPDSPRKHLAGQLCIQMGMLARQGRLALPLDMLGHWQLKIGN